MFRLRCSVSFGLRRTNKNEKKVQTGRTSEAGRKDTILFSAFRILFKFFDRFENGQSETARSRQCLASVSREKQQQHKAPTVGLEPTTTRLRALRSTN